MKYEAMAREILDELPIPLYKDGNLYFYVPIIVSTLKQVELGTLERAADLCERLPIDKERCKVLMLIEQAWEEGQYACAEVIRTLKEEAKP